MNAGLYRRKSSEAEDRQIMSLESQRDEMLRREDLTSDVSLVADYAEARSAKRPGHRPMFEDMLRRIEAGEIQVIICWHPDRLARNMVDAGRIIDLMDRKKLIEIRTASGRFVNTPQDKMNLLIQFVFSKYTVDKLADDVSRGFRKRVAFGWKPGRPPLGYISNKNTTPRETLPDPERFALVERMWRLLLTGSYTVAEILRIANTQWGLRTPQLRKSGGGPLSLSGLYAIFSNTFYAGIFMYDGIVQQGKHQPMITLDEFARAQVVLGRVDRPRPIRHSFTYTGLLKCSCGLSITAEEQVNRYGYHYDYYHCTRRHPDGYCRLPYIPAMKLEEQIARWLDTVTLVPEAKEWLLDRLERFENGKMAERNLQEASLDRDIASAEKELGNLRALRVREQVSEEEFLNDRAVLDQRRLAAIQRRQARAKAGNWIEPARELIEFNSRAAEYFSAARPDIKRLIVRTVGSNPTLTGKTLSVEARKPFRVWPDQPSISTMCTFMEDVRTFFEAQTPECADLLKSITKVKDELKSPEDLSPGKKQRAA